MGLAASQARFLQLTARRSNLEYQGQQINQQRLALANESAGLYQRQLSLVVPTPPSSSNDKYMTPAYDFTDPRDGIKKNIKFTFNTAMDDITGYEVTYNKYDPDGNSITVNQSTAAGTGPWTITALSINPTNAQISTTGSGAGNTMSSGTWYIAFGNGTTSASDNYIDINTGRVTHIIIATASTATNQRADMTKSAEIALTYAPVFDTKAYDDDMNKYEYQKSTYDYEIERINAETDHIQQQDKSLELKLKQLDTEHNAIQTEMEAVQKVIQNNVTSSFKTFSS